MTASGAGCQGVLAPGLILGVCSVPGLGHHASCRPPSPCVTPQIPTPPCQAAAYSVSAMAVRFVSVVAFRTVTTNCDPPSVTAAESHNSIALSPVE